MPSDLRIAHLMYITEWSYQQIMSTPRHILWQFLLVGDAHAEKAENERLMREMMGG